MKTKIVEYDGKRAGIIFLTKEERDTTEVMRRVEELKKELHAVGIFVSGIKSMKKVLQEIIDNDEFER